jgi:hypothetical protein
VNLKGNNAQPNITNPPDLLSNCLLSFQGSNYNPEDAIFQAGLIKLIDPLLNLLGLLGRDRNRLMVSKDFFQFLLGPLQQASAAG